MPLGRMSQHPQPFVCRDEAFGVPPAIAIRRRWRPRQHHIQDVKKPDSHFELTLITGKVKCDQDLIGQTLGISNDLRWFIVAGAILIGSPHVEPALVGLMICRPDRATWTSKFEIATVVFRFGN